MNCLECGKRMRVAKSLIEKGKKYCSTECRDRNHPSGENTHNWKGGDVRVDCPCGKTVYKKRRGDRDMKYCSKKCTPKFEKGRDAWNKGIYYEQIRGEKHHAWKSNNVSYRALHRWVEGQMGRPTTCWFCGKGNLKGKAIHWANKSGEYRRDLSDWLRLCKKCHMKYDGINVTCQKYQ